MSSTVKSCHGEVIKSGTTKIDRVIKSLTNTEVKLAKYKGKVYALSDDVGLQL